MEAHMRKGCKMACNSVRVRGTRVGQVCHHSRVRSVSSYPFLAIFAHFWLLSAIFARFRPFSPIFGHFRPFSPIFGHFRTFSAIFGHFRSIFAIFGPFSPIFWPFSPIFGCFRPIVWPIFCPFLPFSSIFVHFQSIFWLIFGPFSIHFQPFLDIFEGAPLGAVGLTAPEPPAECGARPTKQAAGLTPGL